MGLDKQWRKLAMFFIALALLMPVAAAFAGIGAEEIVNRTHEGIQGGTGTGEYTIRYTMTAQQPGSYPAEGAEIDQANIGWYEITRGNELPNITQIYITTPSGRNLTGEDITCWVNATDSDNRTLLIQYNWYNQTIQIPSLSGTAQATSGLTINISTIPGTRLTAGENWTCEAKAWDGYFNETKWNNATILIQPIPPLTGGTNIPGPGGVVRKETKQCIEAWQCTEWSACNITRARNCTDINNCGKEQYRPVMTEICELRPAPEKPRTIAETIRKEQEIARPAAELPIKEYAPTAIELARARSETVRGMIIGLAEAVLNGIISVVKTAAHLVKAVIQRSINIQAEALHKAIEAVLRTINTLEAIITKSSQEQAGIIAKILHTAAGIIEAAISTAKAVLTGIIDVIRAAIHISMDAAETAISSAREAAARTREVTGQRAATAAGITAAMLALLTPENIEFVLVAIIYLALISAAIAAIRYFIRQYKTEERSRRLRTETRALLAIGIMLQALHFVIFQRELYPAYLAVIAMIAVLAFDLLLKKLPSIEREKEREEEKQRGKVLKIIRENREEIELAEEIRRKLARITAPRPVIAEPLETAEKQRFTRIKNMIQQIKESRIKETTLETLQAMRQRIRQIRIASPVSRIKEYLGERQQKRLLERIDQEQKEIAEQARQIRESRKQKIEQAEYEKERKKEVTYGIKEEQEKWQAIEKNLQSYKKKQYAKPELPTGKYEKIKEKIMALEKPREMPKEKPKLQKVRYEPIKLPKQPEKYEREIGSIIQFQKKLDKYLKKTPAKTKTAKQEKKTKYEWVKREILKMEKNR